MSSLSPRVISPASYARYCYFLAAAGTIRTGQFQQTAMLDQAFDAFGSCAMITIAAICLPRSILAIAGLLRPISLSRRARQDGRRAIDVAASRRDADIRLMPRICLR